MRVSKRIKEGWVKKLLFWGRGVMWGDCSLGAQVTTSAMKCYHGLHLFVGFKVSSAAFPGGLNVWLLIFCTFIWYKKICRILCCPAERAAGGS